MVEPGPQDAAAHAVRAALEELGVEHEFMVCDPDLADTTAFCEAYGVAPDDSANTILVVGKGDPLLHVACVVLATAHLDVNRTVRTRLGVNKASFSPAEDTAEMTGMAIGGVTPFGLPAALPIWVDAAVMDRASIVLGGGSRAWKVRCPPSSLLAIPGVEIVEGLAKPVPT